MIEYSRYRQLETVVARFARRRGLMGDIWADVPDVGTYGDEIAIAGMCLDVRPRPRDDDEREFVGRLIRSVVLSSSPDCPPAGPPRGVEVKTMQDACNEYLDSLSAGGEPGNIASAGRATV